MCILKIIIGIINNIGIMENVLENVAKYLNADPIEVRKLNMYKKGDKAINGDVSYISILLS
jgi:xanthine dehydrogenase molybdopterin-binding subunit B